MTATNKDWDHHMCGCFDNCTVCIVTYFVPCYTAGKIAEKVGDSCFTCALVFLIPIVGCFCSALVRGEVRAQNGIRGSFTEDLFLICCCPLCALVQEAQEVKAVWEQPRPEYSGVPQRIQRA